MRRACSTLAAALTCAPAIAGAQDSQLQVMEQVIRVCTDALCQPCQRSPLGHAEG